MSALRLVHSRAADERAFDDHVVVAIDRHRVGAIIVGAEAPSTWRPADPQLASIVDAVEVIMADQGTTYADAGLLIDVLRGVDSEAPWAAILETLMTAWDAREADLTCMRARVLAEAYVTERRADLEAAHDELGRALERAKDASAGLHTALDLWARALVAADEVSW